MTTTRTGHPTRTRRTAEEVLEAIRSTVLDQLSTGGYASVTFAGVARESGVGKPALYRRYPDRATMIYDAMYSTLDHFVPPAPTGSLRSDLIAWFSDAQTRGTASNMDVYRALVGEAAPETLNRIQTSETKTAELLGSHVIAPAQRTGELGPRPLSLNVVYAPIRMLRDQALFDGVDIDIAQFVDEIVLPLFRGASGWQPTED